MHNTYGGPHVLVDRFLLSTNQKKLTMYNKQNFEKLLRTQSTSPIFRIFILLQDRDDAWSVTYGESDDRK